VEVPEIAVIESVWSGGGNEKKVELFLLLLKSFANEVM